MKQSSTAPVATPSNKGGSKLPENSATQLSQRDTFVDMAVTMSWQLAIVVLVPIIAGVQLGKHANAEPTGTLIGLIIAVIGSALVMWRTLKVANQVPVPKLSEAQKRAIRKSYEEEDED